jgi:hypothetical protein
LSSIIALDFTTFLDIYTDFSSLFHYSNATLSLLKAFENRQEQEIKHVATSERVVDSSLSPSSPLSAFLS